MSIPRLLEVDDLDPTRLAAILDTCAVRTTILTTGLLLARHAVLTGSTVAARVLGGWPSVLSRFVAVVPRDFKRVRAAEARARAEARTPAFSELVGA